MKSNKVVICIGLVILSLVILSYSIILATPTGVSIEGYTGFDGMDTTSFADCSNNPQASGCFPLKYIDTRGNIGSKNARVANGYWVDASGFVQQAPYGYQVSDDKRSISPKTAYAKYDVSANGVNTPTTIRGDTQKQVYDTNKYDTQYHDDVATVIKNANDSNTGVVWVVKDGQLTALPQTDPAAKGEMLYYQPGSYKYGPGSYVPGYEDSVFMSKLTRVSYAKPITDTASTLGGICAQYKSSPDQLEEACNRLDKNVCAATTCCVLIGGEKCVSGGESGPTMKVNYNDPTIRNRDLYYHQGKCYGNCSNTFDYASVVSNSDIGVNSYDTAYGDLSMPKNTMLSDTSPTGFRVNQSDKQNGGQGYILNQGGTGYNFVSGN